ncbi:hypothetical protein [Nocardia sp. NPDC002869]|uniref:hypothetical protein n=1 Tax=Nocardia sp. NPDC002869 TaxID=3161032 RepID=UPI00398CDA08
MKEQLLTDFWREIVMSGCRCGEDRQSSSSWRQQLGQPVMKNIVVAAHFPVNRTIAPGLKNSDGIGIGV